MDKDKDWNGVILDWRSSGLSQSEYCRRSGIAENKLSYWKRKCETKSKESNFISVSKVNEVIELEIGKVKLSLPVEIQAEYLAELVKCLN